MKNSLVYLLFFITTTAYSQQVSFVRILLTNTEKLNVEKRRFFNQPDYEKINSLTDSQLAFQFNRGYNLPVDSDFNIKKIDSRNYLLSIKIEKPEVVFINFHPIYIKPGDSVEINYTTIVQTFDQIVDTITTTGSEKGNYEFAMYIKKATSRIKIPNITSNIYKNNTVLFYKDLKNYYQKCSSMYDSDPSFKACSKELTDYLKRKNNESFMFSLISFENKLLNNNSTSSAKLLGDSLEYAFNNTKFNPSDTLMNFTMENLFKKYFARMAINKFGNLKTEKDYKLFFNYIDNFPNLFVRDYFIMFLVANYRKEVDRYSPNLPVDLDDEIKNKRVLAHLKKLTNEIRN